MIAIYNSKGGVGKSALSYSISIDNNMRLISNDDNQFLKYHPRAKLYVNQKMPLVKNTVYDLGGFISEHTTDILYEADVIIVPVTVDFNSLKRAIKILLEFHDKKVILVANQLDNIDDFNYIKDTIKTHFNTIVYPLRRSIIFRRSLEKGLSIKQLYEESGLSKHSYKNIYAQYEAILKGIHND